MSARWPWSWRVGLVVLALLAGAGLITRSIVARQHERAQITQSTSSAQGGALLIKPADLAVARQGVLIQTLPISGSLEAVNAVLLKSRVSGEILALKAREGDQVRAGQLMATVDAQEYRQRLEQARQQAASAQAQWQIAKRTLETNQGLVAQGFISKNALDTSQSNAAAAKANALAAQAAQAVAQEALDDTKIISPINGIVAKRHTQQGERVSPESPVMQIVDLASLEIEINLRPQELAQVRVGTTGRLTVEGIDQPLAAKVARINPAADPATRAIKVYLSIERHPALRQGLFAQGQLELSKQNLLTIPKSALRRDAAGDFVQVIRSGQIAHQRVTPGPVGQLEGEPQAEPMVSIASSLSAGERLLKESLGVLSPGTAVELAGGAPAAAAR